jgi:hypothetical protein
MVQLEDIEYSNFKNDELCFLILYRNHWVVGDVIAISTSLDIPVLDCQAVRSIARGRGVCGCEKTEWAELVGVDGDLAKTTIEEENPNVGAIIILVGSPVDSSYNLDRVRVFVDENNIVVVMPQVG